MHVWQLNLWIHSTSSLYSAHHHSNPPSPPHPPLVIGRLQPFYLAAAAAPNQLSWVLKAVTCLIWACVCVFFSPLPSTCQDTRTRRRDQNKPSDWSTACHQLIAEKDGFLKGPVHSFLLNFSWTTICSMSSTLKQFNRIGCILQWVTINNRVVNRIYAINSCCKTV